MQENPELPIPSPIDRVPSWPKTPGVPSGENNGNDKPGPSRKRLYGVFGYYCPGQAELPN